LLILAISFLLMLNAGRGDAAIRGELIFDIQNLFWLRAASIFFALLLSLLIFLWSKELIGRWWALLPTFLFSFSPLVLAYGHYFSPDIFAAFAVFASIFTFLNFLHHPSRPNLFLAGLAFGAAQLLRLSAIILIPVFLFLIIVFYVAGIIRDWAATEPSARWKHFRVRAIRYFRPVFIIFFIGFLIIYVGFALREQNLTKPIFDYLASLSSYLNLKGGGWQFLTLFLTKEPLPSLILLVFSFVVFLWSTLKLTFGAVLRKLKFSDYLGTHFPEFSLIVFVAAYVLLGLFIEPLVSANYLASLPFVYILSATAIKNWFSVSNFNLIRNLWLQIAVAATNFWQLTLKSAALAVILISYLIIAFATSPHYLSNFNSLDFILNQSSKYSVQFDYDRGQDLKRLAIWVEKNNVDKIAVDASTPFSEPELLRNYFNQNAIAWQSASDNPKEKDIAWLAASLTKKKNYSWLEKTSVYDRIGKTIFIYKLF